MNNKNKSYRNMFEFMSREERRKKGQRSGFKVSAMLPKKKKGGRK